MIVPRRLHKTALNPPYEIVEEDDPRQAWILCGAGTEYDDAEAERLGITAYLAAYDKAHAPKDEKPVATKAVEKREVEDKALKPEESEQKAETRELPADDLPSVESDEDRQRGIIMPPESRRMRGR